MKFEQLVTGFCFLEAPRVDERGIWFTETALGGVRCLRPDGRIDTWLSDRRPIGGMALNEDGALVLSGPGGLIWLDPATGTTGLLLDTIDGKSICGVNDVMPDGKGGLYFGTLDFGAIQDSQPFGHSALYRLGTNGRVTFLCGGLKVCNGIGLSPDGRRLYHNESMAGTHAYDLFPDGGVGKGVLLNNDPDCDGLAVDREGGVWIACTQSGTIARITPDGKPDHRIAVPGGHVISLCFGGTDWRDLYVVTATEGGVEIVLKGGIPPSATGSIFRARAEIPGVPVARTRFQLPGKH
jgi:sugar lactone lactonase YvrE